MNKKLDIAFNDGRLILGADSNLDGEKALTIDIDMNEGLQEIINRGEVIKDAKIVDYEFSLQKLMIKLDTDRDGDHSVFIELNLAELLDEVGLLKKQ